MLSWLRRALGFVLAFAVGYVLGGGPVAVLVHDLVKMVGVEWSKYHVSRGSGGNFPMLIAGFFFGQGIFLLVRGIIRAMAPARIRYVEEVASWDPGLLVASRFGIQRYLMSCSKWAAEDPSARTQSLILFRVCGVGSLNEARGTLATTSLLRQIAGELRSAALPDTASRWRRFLARFAPRREVTRFGRVPAPRYAGRWSGATFALAFRELQPHLVVAVAQDVAEWIRGELATVGERSLGLFAGIGIGSPRGSARELERAAETALAAADRDTTAVAHDPGDARAGILAQILNVHHLEFSMAQDDAYGDLSPTTEPTLRELAVAWLKRWGPGLGCLAATPLILSFKSQSATSSPTSFPWPDHLHEIPLLSETGASNVRLFRSTLSAEDSGTWKLSEGRLVQPDPSSQLLRACQVRVTITNLSTSSRYVSAADFSLFDTTGREGRVDLLRQVRLAEGLTGKWVAPGESWSGWLLITRSDAPVKGVVFRPDAMTRIAMRRQE
jgi:GGDEF domain-containing protein